MAFVLPSSYKGSEPRADSAPRASIAEDVKSLSWATMYSRRPAGSFEMFNLESLVAKRMELLAWIDGQLNSNQSQNFHEVLKRIGDRAGLKGAQRENSAPRGELGSDERNAQSNRENHVNWSDEEDLISHMLCRFAFCMSEKWRKWFLRVEEVLLRARLRQGSDSQNDALIAAMLESNGLPCRPLTDETAPPKLGAYIQYLQVKEGQRLTRKLRVQDFVSVPLALATRLVKDRQVLCQSGNAIMQYSQAQEVFLTVYKTQLARGLHEAYVLRSKLEPEDEDVRTTMMTMLDAFLTRFVADPQDQLREMKGGVVHPADIPVLAQTHFPLCMRRIDTHLRSQGHLKHHGRLMYGLFLKAIGLSMEDSLVLFSSLMTVKNMSVEQFTKSAYGYNVRHTYGREGNKKNYPSFSCNTIINLPPMADGMECHGCPYAGHEAQLRLTLGKEQYNPLAPTEGKLRLSPSDIEDIVQDAKDKQFQRACYKHFIATHLGARRDSLFRSPFEYYSVSTELKAAHATLQSASGAGKDDTATPQKRQSSEVRRTAFTPTLKEGVTKPRLE